MLQGEKHIYLSPFLILSLPTILIVYNTTLWKGHSLSLHSKEVCLPLVFLVLIISNRPVISPHHRSNTPSLVPTNFQIICVTKITELLVVRWPGCTFAKWMSLISLSLFVFYIEVLCFWLCTCWILNPALNNYQNQNQTVESSLVMVVFKHSNNSIALKLNKHNQRNSLIQYNMILCL